MSADIFTEFRRKLKEKYPEKLPTSFSASGQTEKKKKPIILPINPPRLPASQVKMNFIKDKKEAEE